MICAGIGFGVSYWYQQRNRVDTYTASGKMYVLNANPNVVNYQYANSADFNSALRLIDTYMVVVRSNKVMDVVTERLATDYPGISSGYISSSLSMQSVSDTGVVEVRSRTTNPQLSADICNAVMDVAPAEIIRVVNAGSIQVVDYATVPTYPDVRSPMSRAVTAAMASGVLAAGLIVLAFLLNRKVADSKELTDQYTPPILSSLRRTKTDNEDPRQFMLKDDSPMSTLDGYAKLRMNLFYTMVGKDRHSVEMVSSISGEGKSTIAANLAISCAMSGKKVLLVDGDMRRACQRDIFGYDDDLPGLSDVLAKTSNIWDVVLASEREMLDILPAGHLPPNPAELLSSNEMKELLAELEKNYDLVLLDMPPINIVSDPLVLSSEMAGCLFVVRQNFSDHREIRKALRSAELTNMDVLGFVFYGEHLHEDGYYSRKYYSHYYQKYGNYHERRKPASGADEGGRNDNGKNDKNKEGKEGEGHETK